MKMSMYCTLPRSSSLQSNQLTTGVHYRKNVRNILPPLPPLPPPPPAISPISNTNESISPLPPPPPPPNMCDDPRCDGQCSISSTNHNNTLTNSTNHLHSANQQQPVTTSTTSTPMSNCGNSNQANNQPTYTDTMNSMSTPMGECQPPHHNQKIYYAVDSYDDLKAIRRISVTNLIEDPSNVNPNFYGDDDSAYDSTSNESLRLTAKDVRKYKSSSSSKYFTLPTRLGRRMKKLNFADPTMASGHQQQHSIMASGQQHHSTMASGQHHHHHHQHQHHHHTPPSSSLVNLKHSPTTPSSSSDVTSISPDSMISSSSDTYGTYCPLSSVSSDTGHSFPLPPPPPPMIPTLPSRHHHQNHQQQQQQQSNHVHHRHQHPNCDEGGTSVQHTNSDPNDGHYHCCCRLGCHLSGESNNYGMQAKMHCCQNTLETLWEEPNQVNHELPVNDSEEVYENVSRRFRSMSLSNQIYNQKMLHQHQHLNLNQQHQQQQKHSTSKSIRPKQDGDCDSLNSSVSSVSYQCNSSSTNGQPTASQGWLRGNFLRAFRRSKARPKSAIDLSTSHYGSNGQSVPTSGRKVTLSNQYTSNPAQSNHYASNSNVSNYANLDAEMIQHFQSQLARKDEQIREAQQETLKVRNQLESLKQIINQMKDEISTLRSENESLKQKNNMERSSSAVSSESSISGQFGSSKSESESHHPSSSGRSSTLAPSSTASSLTSPSSSTKSSPTSVSTTQSANQHASEAPARRPVMIRVGSQFIGTLMISSTTGWDELDSMLIDSFKRFYAQIANIDHISHYLVGIERLQRCLYDNRPLPYMLPYGYLVEDNIIVIVLRDDARM